MLEEHSAMLEPLLVVLLEMQEVLLVMHLEMLLVRLEVHSLEFNRM